MLVCVESRASNLFMKRCIRLNLQGKVAQFFSRGYVALLGTTGYKLLYSSRIRMVSDLAAQQQNKVINLRFVLTLVCFSALHCQIFCHWLARSTQKLDFLFNNSGLEYYTAMSCFSAQSAAIRTKTEPGIRFQQPSLIKSQVPLFSDSPPSPPPSPELREFLRYTYFQYIGIKVKKHFKNAHCQFYE